MAGFLTSILGRSETCSTTTRQVGGLKLSVSCPSGSGNDHIPDLIGQSVSEAQRWLSLALTEVQNYEKSGNASEFFRERFAYSFGVQPSLQYSREVSGILQSISRGLNSGHLGIKVMDKTGRGGGVQGTVEADGLYFEIKPGSEIELDLGRLLSMPKRSTKTLIHEAGHVFGHLIDYAYADRNPDANHLDWFERSGNRGPLRLELEWGRARRNADSYAMFVFRLSRPRIGCL